MSYVVLARKWRPSQFDDVVGQGHVARTLKNAIAQDRVAHAFLFAGARGVGKTSTARILAKALNCRTGPTQTPCEECVACKEITAGQAIDVFEIDGASNRGINEIRDLRESVRYAPSRDNYKIYIIDEVHMLTTEAFNALLKTLEEPPGHAKFIFATTEPQKIPVTILSRCQRYDFKRVSQHDIVEHLETICTSESIDAERGALQIIARQAAGGMRDALSLLDQIISFSEDTITEQQVGEVLGVANRRQLFELSEAIIARDTSRALAIVDDVNRYGYDLGQFAAELVAHFRDLTVVRVVDEPESIVDLTDSEIEMARTRVADVPENLLHRYFSTMAEATQDLARSSFPKLLFEMTMVRLTQLEPLVGVDLLIERLRSLEQLLDDVPEEPPENPEVAQPARTREASPPPREVLPAETSEPPPEPPPEPPTATPVETSPRAQPTGTNREPAEEAPPPLPGGAAERWRAVVRAVHGANRPVAMAAEHAQPLRFEDGIVEVAIPEAYAELLRDNERIDALSAAATDLFGGAWRIVVSVSSETEGTLADERDEATRRRRSDLEAELRNHERVKEAQALFDIDPDAVRVQVKLFDD